MPELTPNEYQVLAIRTEAPPENTRIAQGMPDPHIRMTHAMIGLCTESGEIATALKRFIFYGKAIDITNLIEECGDMLWYVSLMLDACGETMESCMKKNINKLSVRYPEKFTEHLAENRRLGEERKELEGEDRKIVVNFDPALVREVPASKTEVEAFEALKKEHEEVVTRNELLNNLLVKAKAEMGHLQMLNDTKDRAMESLKGQLKEQFAMIAEYHRNLEAVEKEVEILREQRDFDCGVMSNLMKEQKELTFNAFQSINRDRCSLIAGYGHLTEWPFQNWALALCGEAGELANLCKKIIRGDYTLAEKVGDIGKEVADVICYADLMLSSLKMNTASTLAAKFNEVSLRRKETAKFMIDTVETARGALKARALAPIVGRLTGGPNLPPIRIYLAARYGRRVELVEYADQLSKLGYHTYCRWLNGNHEGSNEDGTQNDAERVKYAMEDFEDVSNADVVICFTESPDGKVPGKGRGGRHVEMGIALALKKGVIVIGPRENIFCNLPQIVQHNSWGEFISRFEMDIADDFNAACTWAHTCGAFGLSFSKSL